MQFGSFNSSHEGYAVLKEEVDELWDCIKDNKHTTLEDLKGEAVQVADMAIRIITDCCEEESDINEANGEGE